MSRFTKTIAVAAAATLAFGALAAPAGTRNDGSRPIKLSEKTEILGKSVPAGSYALKWTREAGTEQVKLEVTQGHRVLASGKGSWNNNGAAYPHEALVFRTTGGAHQLAEIRFRNSTEFIRIEPAPGSVVTN